MKKIFFFLFLALLSMNLFAREIVPIVTKQRDSKLAKVEVVKLDARVIGIEVVNTSDDVIEIDWNGSSIDGEKLFVSDETDFENLKGSIPNSVIAPSDSITKEICAISQVYWWAGKYQLERLSVPAKIVVKFRSASKSDYAIFTVTCD